MEKTPESLSARNEELDDNIVTDAAITALKKNLKTRADIDRGNGGEVLNKAVQAVDFVHDDSAASGNVAYDVIAWFWLTAIRKIY